jgi:hypothetical protein
MREGKTSGTHGRVQGQGRSGGRSRRQDCDGDRARVRRASCAGGPVEILESAGTLLDIQRGPKPVDESSPEDKLYGDIGRLKMEVDWLKKAGAVSREARLGWIEAGHEKLPLTRQCELASVPHATVYRLIDAAFRQACQDESDLKLRALIDQQYTSRPFYGSRCMVVFLRATGHVVNRKRVQRLMPGMGLAGMAPGPNTRSTHPRHTSIRTCSVLS